jgi:hypothetical protein
MLRYIHQSAKRNAYDDILLEAGAFTVQDELWEVSIDTSF